MNSESTAGPNRLPIEELCRFAAALQMSAIPAAVDDNMRKRLVDFVAIATNGLAAPGPSHLLTGTGSSGQARVIGTNRLVAAADAAWINSAAGHVFGLDDFHAASTVHPGVVVLPSVLALAEETAARIEELIPAAIIGYEVAVRFGNVFPMGVVHRNGFHPTTICGLIGATAGCLRLLGASSVTMHAGLRLAANFAGGLARFTGAPAVKALEVGNAARLGIDLARLANAGVEGPRDSLDLDKGLFAAFGHGAALFPAKLSERLGESWQVLKTSFKPWAQGTSSHIAVDACIKALRSSQIALDDVHEIEVVVTGGAPVPEAWNPTSRVTSSRDAQQSPSHCIAVALSALASDDSGFGTFVDAYEDLSYLNSDAVLGLASKVIWGHEEGTYGLSQGAVAATLHSRSGPGYSATSDTFPGDATRDETGLSWEHIQGRGARLAGGNTRWWREFLEAMRHAPRAALVPDLMKMVGDLSVPIES